ncbi:hypothetical protein BX285_6665 [Streptomyces sp. 1114.5]|uniref:hypothetical protein n=1 Tax=Streptomyces sp. 1114.5 TaxID=1938830 RepID=UPI000EB33736|nr:hypothetical protein [Streptomyces sp. 1114.5]RKT09570.1 hypothetical protein BX285_6665 [Streptomyces sp. 1114.5]
MSAKAGGSVRLRKRVTAGAVLAVAVLALNACGASTVNERSKPTITLEQARKQVDDYLAAVLAALPVKPKNSLGDFSDLECEANDVGPHGRTQTGRGYDFGDVPAAAKAEAVTAYRTFLTGQGFQPVQDPPNFHNDWIKLRNPKDQFLATLDGVAETSHDLTLRVGSPCVWPKGTPPA